MSEQESLAIEVHLFHLHDMDPDAEVDHGSRCLSIGKAHTDAKVISMRKAAFVGPGCRGIHIVSVPTRPCPPAVVRVGHMEIGHWIQHDFDRSPWLDMDDHREVFETLALDDDLDTTCEYYMYYENQGEGRYFLPNEYVATMSFNRARPWSGSLLVLKAKKESGEVVDVAFDDIPDIKRMIVAFRRQLPAEILSYIISLCHVSSLPSLCAVSGECQTMVAGMMKSRMRAALTVYLPQSSHERFWIILDNTQSIVLGAVPLLTFLPSVTPTCLDIALPTAALDEWITFLEEMSYCKASTCSLARCDDIKSTVTLIKETEDHVNCTVNLLQTDSRSAIPVIFYQRLTATMTFATSEEVYCLYPGLTGSGRTLAGHKPYDGVPVHDQEAEQLNLDFGINCAKWNEKCLTNCPKLVRTLYDSKDIGVLRWNRSNRGQALFAQIYLHIKVKIHHNSRDSPAQSRTWNVMRKADFHVYTGAVREARSQNLLNRALREARAQYGAPTMTVPLYGTGFLLATSDKHNILYATEQDIKDHLVHYATHQNVPEETPSSVKVIIHVMSSIMSVGTHRSNSKTGDPSTLFCHEYPPTPPLQKPNTKFSGPMHRNSLLKNPLYGANPVFASSVGWSEQDNGNKLVIAKPSDDNSIRDAYFVVVSVVSENKLAVSPIGNYNPKYNELATSKFQLTLKQPMDDDFAKDWPLAMQALESIQGIIASSSDRRYFLIKDSGTTALRVSTPLCVKIFNKDPGDGDIEGTESVDSWPVPAQHQAAFEGIKETHRLQPLAVYDEKDIFINAEAVPSALKGALVEVTLKLKHYNIRSADKPAFDSFTGGIEQIVVLKRGAPSPPSPFRAQLKKGPTRPSHAVLQAAADAFNPVPQTFKPVAAATTVATASTVAAATGPSPSKAAPSANVPGSSGSNRPSEGEVQLGDKRQAEDDGDQGAKKQKKGKAKTYNDYMSLLQPDKVEEFGISEERPVFHYNVRDMFRWLQQIWTNCIRFYLREDVNPEMAAAPISTLISNLKKYITNYDDTLMHRLSLLKSFKLKGGYPVRNWNAIPEELRSEFLRVFSSPNLSTLALSRFRHFSVTTFAHCHNIMRLKLHDLHINFTPRGGVERFIRRPIPKPTILYIAKNDAFVFARLFKAKWSDTSPIMDLTSVPSIPGSVLHDWKPNIEILAITAIRSLDCFRHTTLVTNLRVLICNDNCDFSEVRKSFIRWRSAGGWKLEELFLMMNPDDGKRLDWENLQTMLNESHFPLLRSINIVQVGGQKVGLTELPWVADSTTVSIRFVDHQTTPQNYSRYLPQKYSAYLPANYL
ncbi:uncharacterized protein LACBIDRAFT_335350 [Laccaria bicolor S238N-H82]|uniref:Predicted protein n=1 Tax=Laccaria bicolor (strain S238N-H82 / ATCC MYA-4686) TaxID=486041 RepID=B0E229_LACBS|nr:uncharacterized protein LACBIDRAFT_335350 [Laccaria bicolor S238N-H82]EDQ99123.1 predicted protein [Laccaria bicolor S238N-H82]|eukprot:XP_001890256.1 predicted protein [Laccaria bicolor S238N-H82]